MTPPPKPDKRTILGAAIFFFLGSVAFFHALTPLRLMGGDTEIYLSNYGKVLTSSRLIYHVREPGAVWLLQIIFAVMKGFKDSEIITAAFLARGFEHLSTICGGVFVLGAVAFADRLSSRPWDKLATFGLTCGGIYFWLFPGHIELYAPLLMALIFLFLAALAVTRVGANPAWAWAALIVAATMHRVALVYVPAFYFLLPPPRWPRRIRPISKKFLVQGSVATLAILLPHILLLATYLLHWQQVRPLPMELTNWLPELVTPLTQAQLEYVRTHSQMGSFHLFTLGSLAHWQHFLIFILISAPAGLVVLLLHGNRLRQSDDFQKFLITAAVCGWTWAFVWHPHRSYGDWDLFCHPGLATNLLAATLLVPQVLSGASRPQPEGLSESPPPGPTAT
ncbi:hypothetical protein CVU37_04195 [candidate division BRC1 bacterium HGW-BRC1-1]|jgi:hypothetical protein|nr:MAG: hypothetical protein CVU37_04195 [candidate division BRC1 bacterium HGW-BRC1-1]